MTAPGDLVLIFILLALFVGCSAYAAGRLHQRYQLRQDREEAYRDGYETASSKVFSLAVRAVVPKRARGAASVRSSAGRRAAADALAAQSADAGAAASDTPSELEREGQASRSVDPGRAVRHEGVTPSAHTAPAPPEDLAPVVVRRQPTQRRPPESPEPGTSFGFPAPPPPPRNTVAEPSAVGGVHYQPLRDPRPADGSGPVLGRRRAPEPASAEGPRFGASSSIPPEEGSPDDITVDVESLEPPSGGKHTVPDELVQAATYRLPPDRVFRARVPNSTPLPEEPTTNIPVQKPRRS